MTILEIKKLYKEYIASKPAEISYLEYAADDSIESAYIFPIDVFRRGPRMPFTVHAAIVHANVGHFLVDGRCYTKGKWRKRLENKFRVQEVKFYDKREWRKTRQQYLTEKVL